MIFFINPDYKKVKNDQKETLSQNIKDKNSPKFISAHKETAKTLKMKGIVRLILVTKSGFFDMLTQRSNKRLTSKNANVFK